MNTKTISNKAQSMNDIKTAVNNLAIITSENIDDLLLDKEKLSELSDMFHPYEAQPQLCGINAVYEWWANWFKNPCEIEFLNNPISTPKFLNETDACSALFSDAVLEILTRLDVICRAINVPTMGQYGFCFVHAIIGDVDYFITAKGITTKINDVFALKPYFTPKENYYITNEYDGFFSGWWLMEDGFDCYFEKIGCYNNGIEYLTNLYIESCLYTNIISLYDSLSELLPSKIFDSVHELIDNYSKIIVGSVLPFTD
ncbi:hypothetical protein C9J21_20675 [Photobacterium phosphoreum]|uniref:hypothetical protein n=1 Tax=Photobacterium phosphoreum TaxID=659 RepID=UPI000D15F77A|nr:hypothetical protein [Photobacterium phosphoreum]PSW28411.1 hypothetical protein C9J21_20675 [Photobacterium phosphoreum]